MAGCYACIYSFSDYFAISNKEKSMSNDSIDLELVGEVSVRTKDTKDRIHVQSDIATGFAGDYADRC